MLTTWVATGLVNAPSGAAPQGMAEGYQALFPGAEQKEVRTPRNISAQDFELLRGRIQANALAAAELAGKTENNLSVVLLLEWHGRRLLFPGDAEWSGKNNIAVKPGKSNGSWNVMWQERQRRPFPAAGLSQDRPPRQRECHPLGAGR